MSYRYAQFKDFEPLQAGPTETYANMAADATDRDVTYAFEHVQVPKSYSSETFSSTEDKNQCQNSAVRSAWPMGSFASAKPLLAVQQNLKNPSKRHELAETLKSLPPMASDNNSAVLPVLRTRWPMVKQGLSSFGGQMNGSNSMNNSPEFDSSFSSTSTFEFVSSLPMNKSMANPRQSAVFRQFMQPTMPLSPFSTPYRLVFHSPQQQQMVLPINGQYSVHPWPWFSSNRFILPNPMSMFPVNQRLPTIHHAFSPGFQFYSTMTQQTNN